MASQTTTATAPTVQDLGANQFQFTGDRTSITFFPVTPGPVVVGHQGGELRYDGPEGNFTFYGAEIERMDSPLGYLLTVLLRPDIDAGAIRATVLVPQIEGVTEGHPVTFGTLLIKTTTRGFIAAPGPGLTYSEVPLVGVASEVILPL